ncbi:hypothetical protein M378DRAFT_168676 [Amanita muscaria Koide BX008]|uniref:Uncharacterized protein n=1 Tax=Amanita muscaria (strain Koide BX008) TaxID=946122 RepID=A0A0C2WEV7_AMAMK|nr:hypothetical protein M378DRAFT_168676 [Amanita muscaria Koide BX008]
MPQPCVCSNAGIYWSLAAVCEEQGIFLLLLSDHTHSAFLSYDERRVHRSRAVSMPSTVYQGGSSREGGRKAGTRHYAEPLISIRNDADALRNH